MYRKVINYMAFYFCLSIVALVIVLFLKAITYLFLFIQLVSFIDAYLKIKYTKSRPYDNSQTVFYPAKWTDTNPKYPVLGLFNVLYINLTFNKMYFFARQSQIKFTFNLFTDYVTSFLKSYFLSLFGLNRLAYNLLKTIFLYNRKFNIIDYLYPIIIQADVRALVYIDGVWHADPKF